MRKPRFGISFFVSWGSGARRRVDDAVERLVEQVGVNLFLRRIVEIDRAGGVAGFERDRAHRGAFQSVFGEDALRRFQNEALFMRGEGRFAGGALGHAGF